jgi:hypothetical protein
VKSISQRINKIMPTIAELRELTYIVPEYPGYFWYKKNDVATWFLLWEPVQGYYSPPRLEGGIKMREIDVPQEFQDEMGSVIGKSGIHFKWITQKSKTKYIFYRVESKKIEIWGDTEYSISFAISLVKSHFEHLRVKNNLGK